MKVCCLCSGLGTRLLPLSLKIHKSLIPVKSKYCEDKVPNIYNSVCVLRDILGDCDIYVVGTNEYFKSDAWKPCSELLKESEFNVTEIATKYDPNIYNNWTSLKTYLKIIHH